MNIKRRNFLKRGFWISAAAFLTDPFSLMTETKADPPVELNFKPNPQSWSDDEISLSWIGHSTVLINLYGTWIITDPVLGERVGINLFGKTFGPSRLTPPALKFEEIPKPDLILLSHAHMDHTDTKTLSNFAKKYPNQIDVVAAFNTADVIDEYKWKSISVLDWGMNADFTDLNISAHEVDHFGWRLPWEKDRSRGHYLDGRSYNSYLIEKNGKKILFGGDTRNTSKLNKLAEEQIDIALMPVGAYNPWRRYHCDPEEALQMADSFNAKYFVPIHCKTFRQGKEPFNEPIDWVKNSIPNYNLKLGLEEIGETFKIS